MQNNFCFITSQKITGQSSALYCHWLQLSSGSASTYHISEQNISFRSLGKGAGTAMHSGKMVTEEILAEVIRDMCFALNWPLVNSQ